MKKFTFWLDSLSIHQSAIIRNLASICDDVTVIAWDEIDPSRRGVGWHVPNFGEAKIVLRPTWKTQSDILSMYQADSIHVFGGIRSHKMVYKTLCESLKSTAYIGVQSEAHKGIGFKGLLRLLRSKYDALQFRERINLILGMGNLGVEWFKKSGYLPGRVFPFGYFVETPLLENDYPNQEAWPSKFFELIFVGQFILRKGWDILLYALHGLKSRDWRLHIVGDGNDRGEFVKLCTRLGLIDTVRFYGVLPNSETMGLISKSDLLVLPSRWDGWGAVVNEALMLGVPVVCSDRCGAADLLDGHERGEVFSSESISSLRSVLDRRISQGKKDPATSDKIREWSKCINGESAANYFMAVINATIAGGSKPVPPWFNQPLDKQDTKS